MPITEVTGGRGLAQRIPGSKESMARPRKCRRVCSLPEVDRFGPLNGGFEAQGQLVMTVDEYETIRLIDLEGLTQEECAGQMRVARSTVQGIYMSARQKLAELLVFGNVLTIDGGDYRLCDGVDKPCGRACRWRRRGGHGTSDTENKKETDTQRRQEKTMKIAIPVDSRGLDARVSANFGRANGFLFYDTETKAENYIENAARMARGGAGIQAAQTIVDQGAVALLTPRLGGNAADVLDEAGVKIYRSLEGTAQENVTAFAEGRLSLLDEVHEGFHGNPRP